MTFEEYKKDALKDPEVFQKYQDLAPDYEIKMCILDAMYALGLSWKELSVRTGISRSCFRKLMLGECNPSLKLLKKIANGLGREVHIKFR